LDFSTPVLKHVEKDIKNEVHLMNTTVYQSSRYRDGAYSASHVVYNPKLRKIGFLFNASITFGNGLNKAFEELGFNSLPSADDLEKDTKDVNDRGRKYLLEAYGNYEGERLKVYAGILDTTSFFDVNEFANDEQNQFLNTDLVNNPLAALPSYNPGLILNINLSHNLSLQLGWSQGSPDTESVYLTQLGFSSEDYHVFLYYTNSPLEEVKSFGISADYAFENLGFFFRFGKNNLKDYRYFLSGGSVLSFKREEIGVGYALRKGEELKDLNVLELYFKHLINNYLHFTFDYQLINDVKDTYVLGFRLNFEY